MRKRPLAPKSVRHKKMVGLLFTPSSRLEIVRAAVVAKMALVCLTLARTGGGVSRCSRPGCLIPLPRLITEDERSRLACFIPRVCSRLVQFIPRGIVRLGYFIYTRPTPDGTSPFRHQIFTLLLFHTLMTPCTLSTTTLNCNRKLITCRPNVSQWLQRAAQCSQGVSLVLPSAAPKLSHQAAGSMVKKGSMAPSNCLFANLHLKDRWAGYRYQRAEVVVYSQRAERKSRICFSSDEESCCEYRNPSILSSFLHRFVYTAYLFRQVQVTVPDNFLFSSFQGILRGLSRQGG